MPVDPSLGQMAFGLPFIDGHTLDGGSDSSILTGLKKTFSNAPAPSVIFQTLSAEHNWPPSSAFTKAGYDALAASEPDDEHGARNGARNLLDKQLGVCVSDGETTSSARAARVAPGHPATPATTSSATRVSSPTSSTRSSSSPRMTSRTSPATRARSLSGLRPDGRRRRDLRQR